MLQEIIITAIAYIASVILIIVVSDIEPGQVIVIFSAVFIVDMIIRIITKKFKKDS